MSLLLVPYVVHTCSEDICSITDSRIVFQCENISSRRKLSPFQPGAISHLWWNSTDALFSSTKLPNPSYLWKPTVKNREIIVTINSPPYAFLPVIQLSMTQHHPKIKSKVWTTISHLSNWNMIQLLHTILAGRMRKAHDTLYKRDILNPPVVSTQHVMSKEAWNEAEIVGLPFLFAAELFHFNWGQSYPIGTRIFLWTLVKLDCTKRERLFPFYSEWPADPSWVCLWCLQIWASVLCNSAPPCAFLNNSDFSF